MVDGGEYIRKMEWDDVGMIIHRVCISEEPYRRRANPSQNIALMTGRHCNWFGTMLSVPRARGAIARGEAFDREKH